ncbi:hypothetical protein HMPREF1485_00902 [Propionibacterium sp. HGH0353]|mgnify:CR=1 FL=1|nr:hypothetical protein HMPREF1485_00902 [Propionibacterium sp. HGH0353]
MSEFVADNGVRVTDEMVRQWASEAESGFEGLQVEPFEGRAWEDAETEPLEPRTIRVSASVWRLIERDASRQGMTVSAWTRQALTREVTQTLNAG